MASARLTASILGSQGWSLYTGLIIFSFSADKNEVKAIHVPSYDVCLHLIAGDGLIQEKELAHVMRACMDENGMKFDEGEVDELTRYQFQLHLFKKLLCAQIPKAQKDSHIISVFLPFWDLGL